MANKLLRLFRRGGRNKRAAAASAGRAKIYDGGADKGPGGLEVEVTTTAAPTASSSSGVNPQRDEVSAMTPATGLPPESLPDHRRPARAGRRDPLKLLPPPPAPSSSSRFIGNDLYPGVTSHRQSNRSPSSSPSRGDMKINIPHYRQQGTPSSDDDDEISAMTPVTGDPTSPQQQETKYGKSYLQRLVPPNILGIHDEDDESRDLTVYEDGDDGGDGSGGGGGGNGSGNSRNGNGGPITRLPTIEFDPSSSPPRRKDDDDHAKAEYAPEQSDMKGKKKKWSSARTFIESKRSWLTSTEWFQKAIDSAFDTIDADKSGDVTLEELYAGLLLIHLNMGMYIGAPACRPASKEYVTEIFVLLDADHSGTLTREEFGAVMKILYSQVFTRIVIQWSLTLMIVPVISQYVVRYTVILHGILHDIWKHVDDDLDPLQRLLWRLWAAFLWLTPQWLDRKGEMVMTAFGKIPKGVWKSLPYTLLTVAQTSILVPYSLNRVEEFFRQMARGPER